MYVYEQITQDEYELPVAIADTAGELAQIVGVSKNLIFSSISHAEKRGRKCRYVKVDIGEVLDN